MEFPSLPHELWISILEKHVQFSYLRDVVGTRAVNRMFRDILDTLVLKEKRYFAKRGEKAWSVQHRSVQGSQHYNKRHVSSVQIAAKFIESQWDNDDFLEPRMRHIFDQIEAFITHTCSDSASDMSGNFRKYVCELITRTTDMNSRGDESSQSVTMSWCLSEIESWHDRVGLQTGLQPHGAFELEAFAIAAAVCNPQGLKHFLNAGYNLNFDDRTFLFANGNKPSMFWSHAYTGQLGSPLENAARCGRLDNITYLLGYIQQASCTQLQLLPLKRSLQLAAEGGHFEVAETIRDFLLQHDAMETRGLLSGTRAFWKACINNHLKTATLFESFLPPEKVHDAIDEIRFIYTGNGSEEKEESRRIFLTTVLAASIARGCQTGVIRCLVQCGAEIHTFAPALVHINIGNPLVLAVGFGHLEIARTLIELGCSTDDWETGHYSACPIAYNDTTMINYLLDTGFHVYDSVRLDGDGFGAIDAPSSLASLPLASSEQSIEVAEILLERYPESMKHGHPQKALINAIKHSDMRMVKLLLKHGLHVSDNNGAYAVVVSAMQGNKDLVELLLDSGADPDTQYIYEQIFRGDADENTVPQCRALSALAIAKHKVANPGSRFKAERFLAIVELLDSRGARDVKLSCQDVAQNGSRSEFRQESEFNFVPTGYRF